MIDAGCKQKEWDTSTWTYNKYHWIGRGKLLEKGACIDADYVSDIVPEKGITKVYSTIEHEMVRDIDGKEGTMSVDFTLTMKWLDPNIKTNFSSEDRKNGRIVISPAATIWTPDLYILNRTSFKLRDEWDSLKTSAILTTDEFSQVDATKNTTTYRTKTTVEMRHEIKATVYCNFNHAAYPMDTQMCELRFGSGSFGAIFVLYDPNNTYHGNVTYEAVNFVMSITFFDEKINHGKNTVGMKITMSRILNSFTLEYYIPCVAIVLVSAISFLIPEYPEGRIGFLVTLVLTLISLMIYMMVSQNT